VRTAASDRGSRAPRARLVGRRRHWWDSTARGFVAIRAHLPCYGHRVYQAAIASGYARASRGSGQADGRPHRQHPARCKQVLGSPGGRAGLQRSLVVFGGWTLGCSAVFWAVGLLLGQIPGMPSRLPMAALVFVVPVAVAVLRSHREGTMRQLGRQFELRSCSPWWWVAGMLASTVPTYADAWAHHGTWPFPGPLEVTGLGVVYTVSGLCEEIGWTGFALPRLLRLTGSPVLSAALLGSYYDVWHVVPFLETGNGLPWVLAQCAQAFLLRCTIVGLCTGSRNKIWMAVLVHALSNLAWSTAPSVGARYDPAFVDLLLLPIAIASLAAGHVAWTRRQALA